MGPMVYGGAVYLRTLRPLLKREDWRTPEGFFVRTPEDPGKIPEYTIKIPEYTILENLGYCISLIKIFEDLICGIPG